MSHKISVIIPSYNHAGTIIRCLDSVFNQSLKPIEVIVVNDGSTDETDEVISPYLDRIDYVNQENQGGNAARNIGFKRSTGDLIIFNDADGILYPNSLELMVRELDLNPSASYAYGKFNHEGKQFHSHSFNPNLLRKINYIHTTSLIRREHFPGFDPDIKKFQDWDLWLTMLEKGHEGVFIDKELFKNLRVPGRVGISSWLPSFVYNLPWSKIGWTPKTVKKYREAENIIRKKHQL